MRILFFGDSITQGFWGVEGGWVERIRRHYDAISAKDLDGDAQPTVFNLGIAGDTSRSLLNRIEGETLARKWKEEPVLVVIAIGTNDSLFEGGKQWVTPEEFRGNIERIISIVRPITSAVILVGNPACDEAKTTPVSWGDFSYTNHELKRTEKTLAAVADKHGLLFVPLFAGFKAKLDHGEYLLANGLHPNDAGHEYIAERVLQKLEAIAET